MKKTIAILLSMFMILSFAACGNSTDRTGQPIAEDDFAKKDTDDNVNSVEDASDNDADSAEISTNDDMSEKDSHTDDMEMRRFQKHSRERANLPKNRKQRFWWHIFPRPIRQKVWQNI